MISCIIIDDEPIARKGLENYIAKISFLRLLGSYSNPDKIDTALLSSIDLIFLDIRLHKANGLQFYKSLRPDAPFAIVVSAYGEYALEGYELNIVDYLVKPVAFERFQDAVLRVKELIDLHANSRADFDMNGDYFFIKSNNQIQKIVYDDILFIEGLSNYVVIHTEARKYLSYLSLNAFVDKLPAEKFVRIHKSYVIALDKVEAIRGNEVFVKGRSLPVSKSYKESFMEIIERRLLKK